VDVAPILAAEGYRVIVPYLRGYGTTRFRAEDTIRSGQQAAVASDITALMDALKIEKAVLGGFDWGARTGVVIAALWPERCGALVSVGGYALNNPDHVSIVIHNYRWRLSLAKGDPQYDGLEQKLAGSPVIAAPTITMASDFDGAAADGAAYRQQFSGKYEHRILRDIGHNVPQEAPREFARAILDADRL
jgi:pimeloyl-ACP methyl ester carboxylesterase